MTPCTDKLNEPHSFKRQTPPHFGQNERTVNPQRAHDSHRKYGAMFAAIILNSGSVNGTVVLKVVQD